MGRMMHDQRGMTLVELLTAMAIASLLMTLSAGALRNYWLAQAVERAKGEVLSQLQRQQERVVSESHPLSFGLRVAEGSSDWGIVKYDPGADLSNPADDTCTVTELELADGVVVSSAAFAAPSGVVLNKCAGHQDGQFIFFYARGTATAGEMTLTHPVTARERGLRVVGLTGKVREF
jgi:prepilin-type N-terminal cleavage/methylation domain-containing protein